MRELGYNIIRAILQLGHLPFWQLTGVVFGLAAVIVCVIFSIPFMEVPCQEEEVYYETVTETEPYTEQVPVVSTEMVSRSRVIFDEVRLMVPSGIQVSFTIDKPGATLDVEFDNPFPGGFYLYSASSHIIHEQLGNSGAFEISLPPGDYRCKFVESSQWGEEAYLSLVMKWTEEVETTSYREVEHYRDITTQVEKVRTVTVMKEATMWQRIFGTTCKSE